MTSTFETAFEVVQSLAKDFHANKAHFLSSGYQESEVRKDFIDKFLIALGWDVNHDWQKNPFEQEVKVERGVSMQGAQRRADYAFSIAPNFRDVRFFCEAKKPFGDIASAQNYFQTIRYGWNAQTPIALLTDFEQFQILDCRYKPDIDSALNHCIRKFHYLEYADKEVFSYIYYLFSREAVANGSLDKFASEQPKKRGKAVQRGLFKGGYQKIDEAFLEELDGYRDTLARSFKNNNPDLDGETLTEITQRTIDRLVFMRFLEDKMIHPDNLVSNFGDKGTAWHDFIATSRKLDGIYNGIVFKQHSILDAASFKVNDEDFDDICEKLANVNSPYDFNSIPIHILGSIYEQFLGKVIVTTDKRARLEEKPEVRKAGGVYYTPQYIVTYIVENTVGKQIAGKSPKQIAEMRFADIACGSGSFLLGVFDHLLHYHVEWFNSNKEKAKTAGCVQRDDGAWHLSLKQRREILINNIYGVDIDRQAVEVAQLSLYLKLLEEETTGTARDFQLEFHETLLPSLNKNIVCGNSLIGTDILTGQLFASDEERKLNPMDYEDRFPEIMKHGGFDAIVGNPPYVNAWDFFENQPLARQFVNDTNHYETADRHWDLYVLFLERAFKLTKKGGRFSYIIPFSYTIQKYGARSREMLLKRCTVESIADIRTVRVFGDVPVITIIPVFVNSTPSKSNDIQVFKPSKLSSKTKVESFEVSHLVSQSQMLEQHESMLRLDLSKEATRLVRKLDRCSVKFGDLCYVNYGAQMSSKEKGKFGKEHVIRDLKENKNCREMISGRDLYRYSAKWAGKYVDWSFAPKMYGPRWPEFFELPKIMIRDITGTHRIEATYDTNGYYCDHTVLCALRNIDVENWKPVDAKAIEASKAYNLAFLAGVVASKCVSAYFYLVLSGEGVRTGGGFHTYPETIRNFPVPKLDMSKPIDKSRHDKMVALVEQLLTTKKQLSEAKSDTDKDFYGNKCSGLDRQIDALVYDLYDLNQAEVKIIEGALNTGCNSEKTESSPEE